MQEIRVTVNQDPGNVSWNYEEIKKSLIDGLEIYKKTVYTDETIKSAKTDLAALRKLSTQINDRKKEIKSRFMEPYDQFEAQVKEILNLINEPIKAINDQVADYESRRKVRVRAEIMTYWQMKSADLPEEIREKAYRKIYDSRWENASATKKSWHDGIDNGIGQIMKEIDTIKSFESEFEPEMIKVYYQAFSLADAMKKMHELEEQKRLILEHERIRKEAEEKKKAEEKRKAEEAARLEAIRKEEEKRMAEETARQSAIRKAEEERKINYEKPIVIDEHEHDPYQGLPCVNKPIVLRPEPRHQEAQEEAEPVRPEEPAQPTGEKFPEAVNAQEQADPGLQTITLQITGTPEQIRKIRGYISFIHASQKEVGNDFDS